MSSLGKPCQLIFHPYSVLLDNNHAVIFALVFSNDEINQNIFPF